MQIIVTLSFQLTVLVYESNSDQCSYYEETLIIKYIDKLHYRKE